MKNYSFEYLATRFLLILLVIMLLMLMFSCTKKEEIYIPQTDTLYIYIDKVTYRSEINHGVRVEVESWHKGLRAIVYNLDIGKRDTFYLYKDYPPK